MTHINVPPLGESITEATVAKLYKKVGDKVDADELLLELETDKVTLEVVAPASGIVQSISVSEGSNVTIDELLVTIDETGASAKNRQQDQFTDKSGNIDKKDALSSSENGDTADQAENQPKSQSDNRAQQDNSKKNAASPAATKLANYHNIDLDELHGSGKGGRITKNDVLTAQDTSNSQNSSNLEAKKIDQEVYGDTRVPMSRLRRTIAKRLKDSQNTAAILTTFNEVDMHNVMQIRKQHQEAFKKKYDVKLGFMSFFVKATVAALQEFPVINAEIDGSDIVYKNRYDIGVAVGTDHGLVVPVVKDANVLPFHEIELEIGRLGKKARENRLSMSDMTGGTFSITNGGTYGSLLSTPIINPPQSGILAMHNIVERPIALDGEVVIHPMMYIALSYDHRIVDGSDAVRFLVRIKNFIESPERILLSV